jgi:hypothetical protein
MGQQKPFRIAVNDHIARPIALCPTDLDQPVILELW